MLVWPTMAQLAVATLSPASPTRTISPAARPPAAEALQPNDNRRPAGALAAGVLTIRLVARAGIYLPEGADQPGIPVFAFGEEGKSLQAPGPMIRVTAGTEIRATVRNALEMPMTLRGLQDRGSSALDTVIIAPGASREVRFRAITPGTYFYFGRTSATRPGQVGRDHDSQLTGAFIVDAPGVKAPADERVFVISSFADTLELPGRPRAVHELITVNGLSWPGTERFTFTVGDTVRWRVINAGSVVHPMHLHGFYYDVVSKGDVTRDTLYTPSQQRKAVTEFMPGGATMSMRWVPTRAGNWLFHCHLIYHIDAAQRLGDASHPSGHANHAEDAMAGLVLGITVLPPKGAVASAGDPVARRKLRVFVDERPKMFEDRPGFSFVLQEGATAPSPDSIRIPSSTIVLHKNEPTEITVINRTTQMTSTHWHGIELESYYDGVADWSGAGTRTAPVLAPGDSFVVRMTPDRAGTFIYHTHSNETVQLAGGLYGPLIVLPEGGAVDTTDRIFLFGDGGSLLHPVVNGTATPAPLEIRAGAVHRLRFVSISSANVTRIRLVTDSLVTWRPFAKDGADLPPQRAVEGAALVTLGPGETVDVEVRRTKPEVLTLEVTTLGVRPDVKRIPVIVR
jgi:FtsP/CotA-like multicopper oxidase with cupredoxin domain